MTRKLIASLAFAALALTSVNAQSQILPAPTAFNGGTGTLEIPHMLYDGRAYYLRLTMADPAALTLQVDESTVVDVTPDGSTVGKTGDVIVGTWSVEGEEGTAFTFNADGTWSMTQAAGVDEQECPQGGVESGTFRYFAFTGVFIPTYAVDENGSCGLSNSTNSVIRMLPDGNTMTILFGSEPEGATLNLQE